MLAGHGGVHAAVLERAGAPPGVVVVRLVEDLRVGGELEAHASLLEPQPQLGVLGAAQRRVEAADRQVVGAAQGHVAGADVVAPQPEAPVRDVAAEAVEPGRVPALEGAGRGVVVGADGPQHDRPGAFGVPGQVRREEARQDAHVVVDDDDDLSAGLQQAPVARRRRARVGLDEQAQREGSREPRERLGGGRTAAVVDDHHLERAGGQRLLAEAAHELAEPVRAAVGGEHHREPGRRDVRAHRRPPAPAGPAASHAPEPTASLPASESASATRKVPTQHTSPMSP